MALSERTFLVECYQPGIDPVAVADAGDRARRAAEALFAAGRDVAYVGATLVAADEVVFHAFHASDAVVVQQASQMAGLPFERVVESVGISSDAVEVELGSLASTQGTGKERGS